MRDLVLFGGAHAFAVKTVLAINRESPTFNLVGFLDDDEEKIGSSLVGYPILGSRNLLPELVEAGTVFFNNVMGHWSSRRSVSQLLDDHGCEIVSLVDPRIDVLALDHDEGVFIGAFANFGHSARIGRHSVIMQSVVLGDETVIGDNVFVANLAGVGSRTVVGADSFIGPNSITVPDLSIGARAVVGAGATVVRDVPDDVAVFNPPATPR